MSCANFFLYFCLNFKLSRQQRIRQRTQQTTALQEAQAMADVNPEFLAALPLNIQEEVLAQQRMEQQRQAAAAANPNDPVNAAEFFQNLQPSLRQAVRSKFLRNVKLSHPLPSLPDSRRHGRLADRRPAARLGRRGAEPPSRLGNAQSANARTNPDVELHARVEEPGQSQ